MKKLFVLFEAKAVDDIDQAKQIDSVDSEKEAIKLGYAQYINKDYVWIEFLCDLTSNLSDPVIRKDLPPYSKNHKESMK